MANTKGRAKAARGKPRRSSTTDRKLRELGTDVAKAANLLAKGSQAGKVIVIPLPRCLAAAPWCLPVDPNAPGRPPIWVKIRIGKRRPR